MFNDKYGLTQAVLDSKKTMTRRLYDCTRPAPFLFGDNIAIAQSYKAIGLEDKKDTPGWNNKMFVKSDLMPHWIVMTDMKIEKLQDISDEDCLREGIVEVTVGDLDDFDKVNRIRKVYMIPNIPKLFNTPKAAFATLIDKVSGKGTWESNPYVYVYSFKLAF